MLLKVQNIFTIINIVDGLQMINRSAAQNNFKQSLLNNIFPNKMFGNFFFALSQNSTWQTAIINWMIPSSFFSESQAQTSLDQPLWIARY